MTKKHLDHHKKEVFWMCSRTVLALVVLWLFCGPGHAQDRTRSIVTIYTTTQLDRIKQGSGFVIGPDVIATAYHVIQGAQSVQITMSTGQSLSDIRIRNYDPASDLALIEFSSQSAVPALPIQDRMPGIDEGLFMAGTAAGMRNQIYPVRLAQPSPVPLRDFIDSRGRPLFNNPPSTNVLQIAGVIHAGMSGGPVINGSGLAVGVLSGSFGERASYGWAIPAQMLIAILNRPSMHVVPQQILEWPPIPILSGTRSTEYFVRKDTDTFAQIENFTADSYRLYATNRRIDANITSYRIPLHEILSWVNVGLANTSHITVSDFNDLIDTQIVWFFNNMDHYRQMRADLASRQSLDRRLRQAISTLSNSVNGRNLAAASVEELKEAIRSVVARYSKVSTSTYEEIIGVDVTGLLGCLDGITDRSQVHFSTFAEATLFRDNLRKCAGELDFYVEFYKWISDEHFFYEGAAGLLRQYEGVAVYVPE
jgi:hypothetical protein